jgi:hypothetical protein
LPLFINVITKLFDPLRNIECSWRAVLTALNLNMRGAPVPSVTGNACQCLAVKVKEMRRAKFERLALRVEKSFDHLDDCIELPEAIQGFLPS